MLSWILGGEEGENRAGKLAMGLGATGLGIATAVTPSGEAAASLLMNVADGEAGLEFGWSMVVDQVDGEPEVLGMAPIRRYGSRPPSDSPTATRRFRFIEDPYRKISWVGKTKTFAMGSGLFEKDCEGANNVDLHKVATGMHHLFAPLPDGDREDFGTGLFDGYFRPSRLHSELAAQFHAIFRTQKTVDNKYRGNWARAFVQLLRNDPEMAGVVMGMALLNQAKSDNREMSVVVDYMLDLNGRALLGTYEPQKYNLDAFLTTECNRPKGNQMGEDVVAIRDVIKEVLRNSPRSMDVVVMNAAMIMNSTVRSGGEQAL